MTPFRALVLVRQPPPLMWRTVRDRLPDLVPRIDDVDRITVLEREESDGDVHLVNEWWASQRVPEPIGRALGISEIGWIDRCEWTATDLVARWTIQPHVLREHITCQGTTSYEPAMGGRGVRVTVEGTFDLAPGALSGLASALERPVGAFVGSVVSTMIPRSTRKVVEAAAELVGEEQRGTHPATPESGRPAGP